MGSAINDTHEIKTMLQKIESIIESGLIGIDEPQDDEKEEISGYLTAKKEGKTELYEI